MLENLLESSKRVGHCYQGAKVYPAAHSRNAAIKQLERSIASGKHELKNIWFFHRMEKEQRPMPQRNRVGGQRMIASDRSLHCSRHSAGLKRNAKAARKLPIPDSARSKCGLVAGSAPQPEIRCRPKEPKFSTDSGRSQIGREIIPPVRIVSCRHNLPMWFAKGALDQCPQAKALVKSTTEHAVTNALLVAHRQSSHAR
jgi:hypothetical protein